MQQKCEYCGSFINDTDEVCPHCGGVNENVTRSANGIPKTIAELLAYAKANNLPLEQMRFFIGEDYRGPRAFGIYEENGIFTVYKNKADGARAVRYRGTDEAYAVNELYQKMRSEVMARKARRSSSPSAPSSPTPSRSTKFRLRPWMIIVIFVLILMIVSRLSSCGSPRNGYYSYGKDDYYYQNGSWYGYDDAAGWLYVIPGMDFLNSAGDYYNGSDYDSGSDYSDFSDSDYYNSYDSGGSRDWDSNWGNDDSWDGGSWDSGDTDWDSDW